MTTVRRGARLVSVLTATLIALLLTTAGSPGGPHAADGDGVSAAAAALRDGPVHVDPRARDALPPAAAKALRSTIERADKPVLVAVLPADGDSDRKTLLRRLRAETGIAGVYAVALGDRFDAGADHRIMSRDAVRDAVGAVRRAHPGDPAAMVTDFTDRAVRQASGSAPAAWDGNGAAEDGGRTGGGTAAIVTLGVLVLLAGGGAFLVSRGSRRRRARLERAGLEKLRPVVDEDITAFGEELSRIGFDPATATARPGPGPGGTGAAAARTGARTDAEEADAAREDYARALDGYDAAKTRMAAARRPQDVREVSRALADGRFALATLEARLHGAALPERRAPCFFDPRHGPSVEDVQWAPPGGTERAVPVCAADAARLAGGEEPAAREVGTPQGPRPYWEAGPVYAPWAAGYFGGGLLPGLLMGTLLGGALGGPYPDGSGDPSGGGDFGGDFSGGGADPRDFGGGFGDGGGFGGGDFGGGF
ncbi:hypothetical protein AN217_00585 [Streptomyces qinglanensis]|uniref:TPM domain-containing protein n=1 Tax=Streptomyces qinglanensis TaxID=943816 RepID=A0A1E7KD99_9ACTN|nr:hypothetical protein [Streptomyces qinglanensis]OEV01837.1 hypothetical protein AN217_00585 [Streptomyces qinglanensis]